MKNLCKRAVSAGSDPWLSILQWRNTPSDDIDCSPAQRLMARRLKTPLPVADRLLEPCVVTGVSEKLRAKHQKAKFWYDKSARDLPDLNIGQPVRMQPLPGDRTGRWRKGVCLQQVGPQSYLVDVEGTLYRRNRVALRPAEQNTTAKPIEDQGSETDSAQGEKDKSEEANSQKQVEQSTAHSPESRLYKTSRGRLVKAPERLNL